MTTKTKFLALLAFLAIGIGIYANYMGSGNEHLDENANQATSVSDPGIIAALKTLNKGKMAAMRILDEPVDLTKISFSDGDGKPLTIGDWKGRTVLLNLWATWCPPCRHEMPSLEDLEKKLGGAGFEVVTVSIDLRSPAKPKAFFEQINLTELGFYWDGSAKIFQELKKHGLAFGMPSTVLIDRNGMALGVLNGPAEWNSDAAVALVKAAITK